MFGLITLRQEYLYYRFQCTERYAINSELFTHATVNCPIISNYFKAFIILKQHIFQNLFIIYINNNNIL
jgi:hypothetical protein